MKIEERAEKAVELKHNRHNCCQAVCVACADLVQVSAEDLYRMASGFASGMGCMEATCGALVGAGMIAGLLRNGQRVSPVARNILQDFQQKCGATICKDLKGRDTGKVLCECDDCVRNGILALGKACPEIK
ncbi:MAG: C-GCAxxG-C-C family protein [Lachnospiraceae bacterium]|nr:C-GCAxxG-C-C family protein [Lachnospiraceae bacterium]